MENTLNPTPTIPTFQRKPENNMGCHSMHDHETEAATTSPCKSTRRKILTRRKNTRDTKAIHQQQQQKEKVEEEEDEKEELEKKILALQRLVPGGESLGVDTLFEETAEYILALQCQIKAMKFLARFIEGLEKKNRKFGG